jgi:hypothetical protein
MRLANTPQDLTTGGGRGSGFLCDLVSCGIRFGDAGSLIPGFRHLGCRSLHILKISTKS